MKMLRHGLLGLAMLGIGCAARGQVVIWEITGANATVTNPQPATSLAPNIASASLTLGSGVTAASAADTFGGSGFNNTSLAGAISTSDYLAFLITPAPGYQLSISSVSITSGVSTAVTSFHGELLSNATGFTPADALHSYFFSTTSAPVQSITLSGVSALQNVPGPVEFRLYGWRDTAGTSTFRIRNLTGGDLVIAGAVTAIPEPAACAALLGGIVLVGIAIRRHWGRRAT